MVLLKWGDTYFNCQFSNHLGCAIVLLFFSWLLGFLQVVFSITNMQAHPGQSVSMWCPHNIHVSGNLYWFKQTDSAVPITILRISFTESQKVDKKYLNDFTRDNLVTHHFNKSTNLTIKNVSISDSGFYFCGTAGDQMEFGHGTRLEVKGNIFNPVWLYCHVHSFMLFFCLPSKWHNGKWLILVNCFKTFRKECHIREKWHKNLRKGYVCYIVYL